MSEKASSEDAVVLSRSEAAETQHLEPSLCKICQRQFSRYTCPRCNLLYCSLPCFRSSAHNQCSEPFYRAQLESDVNSAPSKSMEERKAMMDLLKRFEDDNLEDPLSDGSDEEDEGASLESRLLGLDLDHTSYDDLWNALTPLERGKFMNAMQDPASELAQQLLDTSLLDEAIAPWWELTDETSSYNSNSLPNTLIHHSPQSKQRHAEKPQLVTIPPSLIPKQPSSSFALAYNLVAVLIAYAYTTRHLSCSPLSHPSFVASAPDSRETICTLVPFLADKRATARFATLESVVTDVWSRFEEGSMTSAFFSLLLRDVSAILKPRRVVIVPSSTHLPSSTSASPHLTILLALSDMHNLFENSDFRHENSSLFPTSTARHKSRNHHVAAKIVFYAAQVMATSVDFMDGLSSELAARAARENASTLDDGIQRADPAMRRRTGAKEGPSRLVVEVGTDDP